MKSFCASMAVISLMGVSATTAAPQASGPSTSAPTLVRIDGQLKTPTGDARTGSVTLVVSLYAEKDDATPLWVEPQVVTLDAAGRYTIFAGATLADGVPTEFLSGATAGRWLGVAVQGEAEQFRLMLVTVPYAAKAQEADTLAGKAATDFVLSENLGDTVKAALKADLSKSSSASGGDPGALGTLNVIQKGAGGAAVQDATGFVEVGGNVGIGTGTPSHLVHILQTSPTGNALNVNRNLPAASTDSPVMYLREQHAGDDQPALLIDNFGAGAAMAVTTGNVGIGTASPAAALDINRSTAGGATAISVRNPTAGPANYARLDLKTDATGGRGLFDAYSSTFTTSGNSVQSGVSFTAIGAGGFSIALQDPAAPMRFYTGAGPSERLRIDNSGNVGIGTQSPSSKLDVVGNVGVLGQVGILAQDALRISAFQPFLTLNDTNSATGRTVLQGADGGFVFYTNNSIGGNPPMVLRNSGRLGLGTTSPNHRLSIANAPPWTSSVWFGGVELENAHAIGWRSNASGNRFGIGQANGGLFFFATASDPGTTGSPSLTSMMIDDGGRIGMGTTTPRAKVDVVGNVVQQRTANGLVKAMAYVRDDGAILSCYNSLANGGVISTTPPCGMSVTVFTNGGYGVNFGAFVRDRFVSVTPEYAIGAFGGGAKNRLAAFYFSDVLNTNVDVYTFEADEPDATIGNNFMILLF